MSSDDVPKELLHFLKRFRKYFIVGHREPDGDCIGSQLALAAYLKSKGKDVVLVSAGPFARTEIQIYEDRFHNRINEEQKTRDSGAIIVDCSNLQRTGSLENQLGGLPLCVIDHHTSNETSGEAMYIDTDAPSVTYMIHKIIEALGDTPSKEIAEYLLFGLCTDTGFFRHMDEKHAKVFESCSRMVASGASPKKIYTMMTGGKTLKSRKLMGEILTRTQSFFLGKLLISYETLEDSKNFGLESRDSDMIYQLLQSVQGVEAVVLIRQETEDNCTVGFRSKESVDVSAIAKVFGGGGHRQAAGLSIPGTIDLVEKELLEEFAKVLN